MKNFLKKNKVLLIIVASIFVIGIAIGAFLLIKNRPAQEKEEKEEKAEKVEETIEEKETNPCGEEEKICPDGSIVKKVAPACKFAVCPGEKEGIIVSLPKPNQKVQSPLSIKGEAKGNWYFEAIFHAELFDADENSFGKTILQAKGDWMTENFVPFEGKLDFKTPTTPTGVLKFLNENPSGLLENQKIFEVPVQFEELRQ